MDSWAEDSWVHPRLGVGTFMTIAGQLLLLLVLGSLGMSQERNWSCDRVCTQTWPGPVRSATKPSPLNIKVLIPPDGADLKRHRFGQGHQVPRIDGVSFARS